MAAPAALSGDALASVIADPARTMRLLDALECEERLLPFLRLFWPVLEPARPLVEGWVLEEIAEHLEAVSRGEIKRLLINVPPGTSKSLLVSTLWPAWEWGPRKRPDLRYVVASYAEALTIRDNRRCRNVITSGTYQSLWGDVVVLDPDQNTKQRYDTTARGFRIATSVGGLGTGERGDRFIIDDPHSVQDVESESVRESTLQWVSEVVPTRVTGEDSAIVAIMQRTHGSDVSGLFLRSDLGYEWLCLPMEFEEKNRSFTAVPRAGVEPETRALVWEAGDAIPRWITPEDPVPIGETPKWREVWSHDPRRAEGEWLWPARFSPAFVDGTLKPALRSWGGSYAEAGQLQQRPAPRAGGDMQKDDFRYYDELPDVVGKAVRGWDLAGSKARTAKYTCGVKLLSAEGRIYVVDVVRDRFSPGEVEEEMRRCAVLDGARCEISVPVDPGQAGLAQKRYLAAALTGFDVHFSPETGSKEVRARGFSAQVEANAVYLPRWAKWTAGYIGELVAFPGGAFSDQVDATSRAFARLVAKKHQGLSGAPEVVEQGDDEE